MFDKIFVRVRTRNIIVSLLNGAAKMARHKILKKGREVLEPLFDEYEYQVFGIDEIPLARVEDHADHKDRVRDGLNKLGEDGWEHRDFVRPCEAVLVAWPPPNDDHDEDPIAATG